MRRDLHKGRGLQTAAMGGWGAAAAVVVVVVVVVVVAVVVRKAVVLGWHDKDYRGERKMNCKCAC